MGHTTIEINIFIYRKKYRDDCIDDGISLIIWWINIDMDVYQSYPSIDSYSHLAFQWQPSSKSKSMQLARWNHASNPMMMDEREHTAQRCSRIVQGHRYDIITRVTLHQRKRNNIIQTTMKTPMDDDIHFLTVSHNAYLTNTRFYYQESEKTNGAPKHLCKGYSHMRYH